MTKRVVSRKARTRAVHRRVIHIIRVKHPWINRNLQPDISACGGLSEGQKIVALASSHQTPVCLHVWGSGISVAAALQLTAAIPPMSHTARPRAPENEPLFEFDRTRNPLRDDLIAGGFNLEVDQLRIPQGHGLGVEIDEDVLKHHCVASRLSQ